MKLKQKVKCVLLNVFFAIPLSGCGSTSQFTEDKLRNESNLHIWLYTSKERYISPDLQLFDRSVPLRIEVDDIEFLNREFLIESHEQPAEINLKLSAQNHKVKISVRDGAECVFNVSLKKPIWAVVEFSWERYDEEFKPISSPTSTIRYKLSETAPAIY